MSLSWQQIVWGTWCFAESLEEILFGSSKVSHVFYRRYHCSIYFLLHVREDFWVIVNLLWISKDTIYGNVASFCTRSFSFNFCILSSCFMLCVSIHLSKSQCQWKVSYDLCVYLCCGRSIMYKRLEAVWGTLAILAIMRARTFSSPVTPSCILNLGISIWSQFHRLFLMLPWDIKAPGGQQNQLNCFIVSLDFFLLSPSFFFVFCFLISIY